MCVVFRLDTTSLFSLMVFQNIIPQVLKSGGQEDRGEVARLVCSLRLVEATYLLVQPRT